ncbi:hypothetical protein [Paraglaciecola aestuariivivens]
MAAPLLWLGAGALAWLAKEHYDNNKITQSVVETLPGASLKAVAPKNGAVVCCGVFGMFEHTGIWVDGNIVELKGNGLIRGISPARFLKERSGENIYIACNENAQPLIDPDAASRAAAKLFSYSEYHVLNNNCHKFVWYCLSGQEVALSRFSDLNCQLADNFNTRICWHRLAYG